MIQLANVICNGWPDDKRALEEQIKPFWTYRDELGMKNGIIYKGSATVVPPSMRRDMLQKIHANHMGAESNIRFAKDILFWPGMKQSIKNVCEACTSCAQYNSTAPVEPMRSLPLPTLPWQIISQDICEWNNTAYLVTVCHYSDWIEVDQLTEMSAEQVIKATKAHFGRFGIPQICHTDNGG